MAAPTSTAVCQRCGGRGWVVAEREGRQVAARFACRREREADTLLAAARIPPQYARCTLENFYLWDPRDATLGAAKRRTQEFVGSFRAERRGLLFRGPVGTGKTHLAVAALAEIVTLHRVRGLYVNFTELVLELQMAIDGFGRRRDEILPPIVEADLVVLDELGAAKPTPWVMDLMYYVVNARYMANRLVLVTSNFTDGDPHGREGQMRERESLADRISAPVRSRLWEMCDLVELTGRDFRRDGPRR